MINMRTGLQIVYIGKSAIGLRRIVRARRDRTDLGIQVGYVEHRRERIHVWRPCNPIGLGLRRDWKDGRWRNMYELDLPIASPESDDFHDVMEVELGEATVSLPAAILHPTRELERHLRQHLR